MKVLVSSLYGESSQDSYLSQNALGTLQKFSLRKEAQNQMIQFEVIKWIVETIRDELDQLSDYTLEYATALLMNLSLRAEGKNKCEGIPEVLQVLTELIESAAATLPALLTKLEHVVNAQAPVAANIHHRNGLVLDQAVQIGA